LTRLREYWGAIRRIERESTIVRALKRFDSQHMTDAAASLTYYALLSLLPVLVVATSLFSLLGDPGTVAHFVNYLADRGADHDTAKTVEEVMNSVQRSSNSAAVGVLIVSVLVSLNSASSAFGAAGRALNVVLEIDEERGFVRRRLINVAMALVIAVLLAIVIATILLGEGLAHDLLRYVGLEGFATDLWLTVRIPVAIGAATLAYSLIYSYAPDRTPIPPRMTLGTVVGVVVWIVASIGFAFYLRHFATYGAAYGAFGAVIVLLLWTWISCCTLLLGAELDHVRAERKQHSDEAQ
jgi:membrane protein